VHSPGPTHTPDPQDGGRLAIFIAVLLGLAAIVTAFSAYKNELRNHEATIKFNEGVVRTNQASQAYTQGSQVRAQDGALFLEFAKAANANQQEVSAYIHNTLMSPTLRKAVDWWSNTKDNVDSPFVPQDPFYKISQNVKGDALTVESRKDFKEAKHEQNVSDEYTLVTVILASALFLLGIAGVSSRQSIKIGAVSAGGLIFLIALISLATI
jgi:hypothetical protein